MIYQLILAWCRIYASWKTSLISLVTHICVANPSISLIGPGGDLQSRVRPRRVNRLAQDRRNSILNTMDLHLFTANLYYTCIIKFNHLKLIHTPTYIIKQPFTVVHTPHTAHHTGREAHHMLEQPPKGYQVRLRSFSTGHGWCNVSDSGLCLEIS